MISITRDSNRADMEVKKKKKYGGNKYTKSKQYTLGCNQKGFLASCNGREKECIGECYNILNQYTDTMESYSDDNVRNQSQNVDGELEAELSNLRAEMSAGSDKRFQVVDSGAKNFLFIRTTIEDPVKLATTIVKDISETKQLQARHLIRLIPIEITCKAYLDTIKKACEQLLDKHFKNCTKSFSIAYNHRNSTNDLTRDTLIAEIAKLVSELGENHPVDLDNADVTIVIEVIRSIALLAVIPDYLKYKKFNLHSLCGKSSVRKSPEESCSNGV